MKRMLIMMAVMVAGLTIANYALAQGSGFWGGGGKFNLPDSLQPMTVSGTVKIQTFHTQTLYFLDTNRDGNPDYLLIFGPEWYQPASGAQRPKGGDSVTIFGAGVSLQNLSLPVNIPAAIVVYEINGLKWRDPLESIRLGWNRGGLWGGDPWGAFGDTITVTGEVLIDPTCFNHFLDVNEDGKPDYELDFGPPWYQPEGVEKPKAGQVVTIFGRLFEDDEDYDLLTVYMINGQEWRQPTGPAPWAGGWIPGDLSDSLRTFCVNDSANWINFPPGFMGRGGNGGSFWPDSVFIQFWRIPLDSLPGKNYQGFFSGFFINVFNPQGQGLMGRQTGSGRGQIRFNKAMQFRFQYGEEDLRALGLAEKNLAVRAWNTDTKKWQDIPDATINTSKNTVTFASTDLRNYYALYAPTALSGVNDRLAGAVPDKFVLEQNYPNPFNPSTTIHFEISEQSLVRLQIFNVLGQKVTTLLNAVQPAGKHTLQWDGRDDHYRPVTSGVYLLRLEAGGRVLLRRIALLK